MSESVVFEVPTQAEADVKLAELEKQGYLWFSGTLPTSFKHFWSMYEEESYIRVIPEVKRITYGQVEFLTEEEAVEVADRVVELTKAKEAAYLEDWFTGFIEGIQGEED